MILSRALFPCLASAQNVSEQYLFSAANHVRAENGLQPLRFDSELAIAALGHARVMAAHGSISHQFPGEPNLAARVDQAGVRFSLVTENVAEAPDSSVIHELWMGSAGHRANLLDPAVDSVGVAVVSIRGQLYAVQDFVHSVPHLTLSAQEDLVTGLLAQSGLNILRNVVDARETCQLPSGYAGQHQPWFVMRYTAADLSRLPEELRVRLESGRYHSAAVGACVSPRRTPFSAFQIAVLLYP